MIPTAEGATLSALARAKVNLTLHVTGRRPADGYHLLDSLVVFPEIGDRLTAAPADALSLAVTGPHAAAAGAGTDNLVLRAAEALRGALARGGTGRPEAGAALTLEKTLPVASGVGGGSSDAATALRLLSALWDAPLSAEAMAAIALPLGADIPVCLSAPRPQWMRGVGESLSAAPAMPDFALALVNPGAPVSTPAVFKALNGRFGPPPAPAPSAFASVAELADWLGAARNDLEAPARALAPDIDAALDALRSAPGCVFARLSGSGATCWGLFERVGPAEAAAQAIRSARPAWWAASGAVAAAAAP